MPPGMLSSANEQSAAQDMVKYKLGGFLNRETLKLR